MSAALLEALRATGKEHHTLEGADGSRILVLPHGGRVLGLFAPRDERNFLWTNPALETAPTARALYASDKWHNSGGDRIWLAPEIDFFLPAYPKLSSYHQPRALDPGTYRSVITATEIQLAMDLTLTLSRKPRPVDLRLTRTLRLTPDPLGMPGIQYAGFQAHTVLEALGPIDSGIGIWSLLQLPSGGEMIIPTYHACQPLVVFGDPPPGDIQTGEREVRYRMAAVGNHKISIPALCSTGRIGYFHEDANHAHLIVRNFFVNPSGNYVDAAWNDPADTGYGVQACNLNSNIGIFNELEYHAPAMSPAEPRSSDTSQVWAYRGTRPQLAEISRQLLGSPL